MRSTQKQELKRNLKRIGLFLLIVFIPVVVLAVCLAYAGLKQWLNVFVLVLALFIFFFIFGAVCAKMDKKKSERMSKKKDPFSD